MADHGVTAATANWTDTRIEILKKLLADGLSCTQIAEELGGITRNAVIGKIHRLGLSGRAKKTGQTMVQNIFRPSRAVWTPKPTPKPKPLPKEAKPKVAKAKPWEQKQSDSGLARVTYVDYTKRYGQSTRLTSKEMHKRGVIDFRDTVGKPLCEYADHDVSVADMEYVMAAHEKEFA